ncbi:hypothetical protein CW749_19805 [Vibrio sp. vnigr-6D03]|nr:hypothetical protein CW749_19805 [Vibrio sp. vnigr-6D03]RTZ20682.1 hypothetical protein EKN09_23185 [Vibrio penaeicida]
MLGFHAALPILDLEPLDLQIGALPENQAMLAEPSILRWFEYVSKCRVQRVSFECTSSYCFRSKSNGTMSADSLMISPCKASWNLPI